MLFFGRSPLYLLLNTKHIPYVIFIRLNAILNMNNYCTCFQIYFFFATRFFCIVTYCRKLCALCSAWRDVCAAMKWCFSHLFSKYHNNFGWSEKLENSLCSLLLLLFSFDLFFVCAPFECMCVCVCKHFAFAFVLFCCMCNDRMRIYVFYDSGEIIK